MAVTDFAQLQQIKAKLKKGATPEQKTAINYFLPDEGCLSFLSKVKDEDYDAIVKSIVDNSNTYKRALRDFSGGPVAKTPGSQCRGPRFHPWSGN